ncbi:MAG: hypothetical protein EBR26_06055 [Microbacteriaceae bacterium]|nr:hypothetical protein [Microbacteriaceae bacterium]
MSYYPPRPSILWTRRVLVLLVLGGLIWGGIALVNGVIGWVGGIFNPNQNPNQVAGGDCQPQQIRVEAHVGKANKEYQGSFDANEYPYFWFTVTNTGTVECKFNAGPKVTFYSVKSGSDNVWNSKDCKLDAPREDYITLLKPSEPVANAPSDWQRVRSSADGCSIADGQPTVTAGGASYTLTAEVNGVISENTTQFVLN